MGALSRRMEEDLKLKNYARPTRTEYLRCARRFAVFHMRSPSQMGEREIRDFLLHLSLRQQKSPSVLKMYIAAIRFLYASTLRRPEEVAWLSWPKIPRRLPDILTVDEVEAVLAAVEPLEHRVIVMTAYGAGLRISEACALGIADINSARGVIHVRDGKRARDRYVMLPRRLLDLLREYWRQVRPKGPYLFPGGKPGRPLTPSAVRAALKKGVRKAGVKRRVTPHLLRHAFATHLLEAGANIRVIQALLGHSSIRTTARYMQVSARHVASVKSPLDHARAEKPTPPPSRRR